MSMIYFGVINIILIFLRSEFKCKELISIMVMQYHHHCQLDIQQHLIKHHNQLVIQKLLN